MHRPHHRDLFLDRDWIVLFLLKKLDNALTTIETRFCRGIKIGAKLRECGQLAELRQIEFHFAGHLFDGFNLRGGTDPADGETDRNSRSHTLIKQIGLKINLSIRD